MVEKISSLYEESHEMLASTKTPYIEYSQKPKTKETKESMRYVEEYGKKKEGEELSKREIDEFFRLLNKRKLYEILEAKPRLVEILTPRKDIYAFLIKRTIEELRAELIKPYLETPKEIDMEARLTTILQRTSRGEFILEDARDFIKIRRSAHASSDKAQKIWMNYIKDLLGPVYSSLYSFAVIGILAEEEGPLSFKDIRNRVQKIFSEKFDRYKRCEFNASFDALVHPAITNYPLIKEHGIIFKKYTLTEEGRIAYTLLEHSIEEVLHSGEKKVD